MPLTKEGQKEYYENNKENYYFRYIFNTYGLTKEKYLELLVNQNNKCLLCNQERKLHIDHCHETMRIRGLLCLGCNVGLGMLGDNEEGLTRALAYVKGELN